MARGPAPDDRSMFATAQIAGLRTAVEELSWLRERGYAENSALQLVGDRHELRARQRTAVLRCTCTAAEAEARASRRLALAELRGRSLWIDGFNVLIGVEVGYAGGVLLRGRDGALRDLASVHGNYRRTEQTLAASEAVGAALERAGVGAAVWIFDRPVSNSGRLKLALDELAAARGWPWTIELDYNPDRRLAACGEVVATGDAWILDQAPAHVDLTAAVIEASCPAAWILDLRLAGAAGPR